MRQALITIFAVLIIAVRPTPAQPRPCSWPELAPDPRNLHFADGSVGAAPIGWLLGPEWFMPRHEPVYQAIVAPADQCHSGQQCATVHSLRLDPAIRQSFLYQDLDASPYRGQILTCRAYVRVDAGGIARLLVRVHRKDCSTTFRDDMGDHPVTSRDWAAYEIHAPIAIDGFHIEFGVQLIGQGTAWIDQISMEFAPMH
jgi:hypothetical protein